jgi:ankyrin repeat protein
MFDRGLDSKAVDKFLRTPLHYACEQNFHVMVDELLKRGANLNQADREDNSPFSLGLLKHFNQFANQVRLAALVAWGLDLNQTFLVGKRHSTLLIYLI